MSASIIDVAERARVSLGTVSNVLNHPDRVAAATRERVLAAITELGFVRNEAARQLRAGRSRAVGFVVLDMRNPFFTDLAEGVEAAIGVEGFSLVLCSSANDETRQERYLGTLQEQRAYGILVTPVGGESEQIERLRAGGTPVVFVDRVAGNGLCSVSVDDVFGGRVATEHLLAEGHQRLAFIGGPQRLNQVADRLAGMRAAVRAAKLKSSAVVVVRTETLDVAAGRRAGAQLAALPADRRPTAAFCANDLLALGLLQEMTAQGLRAPADLAIVGYDDIEFAAAAAVPLTSVRQPRADIGRAAAELLLEEARQAGAHRHRQVVFSPELIVRESSRSAVAVPRSRRRSAAAR